MAPQPASRGRRRRAAVLIAAGAAALPAAGQDRSVAGLSDLTLEQLSEVVVSTVSRLDERLDRVAASVYVVSAEDIRRAGATNIPQALRLAPTLTVAQADANQYAISARGFNNVLANKMLVLIDGRAVYSPLFSGVFWEAQDVALEDVDRIEVITGPSTALWGSNAVNGLIHIITRPAAATQGPSAATWAGPAERGASLRHGVRLGDVGWLRTYLRSYDHDSTRKPDGSPIGDRADGVQGGLRAEASSGRSAFTLQADAYRATIDQGTVSRRLAGANLLGRWDHVAEDGATTEVQVLLDHVERNQPQVIQEVLDIVDLEAQHAFRSTAGHRLIVGGGWRHARDQVDTGPGIGFIPASRRLNWSRAFVQDHVALSPELELTLIASVERNPYTGNEFLPSLRLAWRPDEAGTWWASLSHAARAPSRIDRELVQPAQPPYVFSSGGTFRSETADVLELGHRAQPSPALSYAVTFYNHRYRRLRSITPTAQGLQFGNGLEGTVRGLELWSRWRVLPRWRLDAGVLVQSSDLAVAQGALDVGGIAALGNDPRHQAQLRSTLDLGNAWAWDFVLRHVGALPNPAVPAYTALDTRVAWRFAPAAELALVVRNVGDARHPEWGVANNRAVLERSLSLQLRWQP